MQAPEIVGQRIRAIRLKQKLSLKELGREFTKANRPSQNMKAILMDIKTLELAQALEVPVSLLTLSAPSQKARATTDLFTLFQRPWNFAFL